MARSLEKQPPPSGEGRQPSAAAERSKSPARRGPKSPAKPSASPRKSKPSPAKRSGNALSHEGDGKAAQAALAERLNEKHKALAEARQEISLLSCPLRTLHLFAQISAELLLQGARSVATSPAMKFFGYWVILAYAGTHYFLPELYSPPTSAGAHGGPLYMPELQVYEAVWWLVLGILSSVGFGTGLHSGVMFLWPHTMSVVLKAQEDCVGTNFNAMYNHPYNLHCYSRNDGTLSFLNQLMLLLPAVVLWGIGTAVGELPPYFVTRAARRAGSRASDFEEELAEAKTKTDLFSRLKVWTIDFTKNNGFLGVFLLASWPNAAFDMCGMACGWLDMPFWTFFGATCLGKGLVKVSLQASVCITVFGKGLFDSAMSVLRTLPYCGEWMACKGVTARQGIMYKFALQERKDMTSFFSDESSLTKEALIEKYCSVLEYCSGDGSKDRAAKVLEKVDRVFAHLDQDGSGDLVASELKAAESLSDGKFSLDSLDPGSGSIFSIGNLWNAFILGLIIFFLISIVDQMAKSKQAQIDEAETQLEEEKLSKSK